MTSQEIITNCKALEDECRSIIEEVKRTRGITPEATSMLLGVTHLNYVCEHLMDILQLVEPGLEEKTISHLDFHTNIGS